MEKEIPSDVPENKVIGSRAIDINMQKVFQFHNEVETLNPKGSKRYRMYLMGTEIVINQDPSSLSKLKKLASKYLDVEGDDYSSDSLVASKAELQALRVSPEGGEVLWEPRNYFKGQDPVSIDEWVPQMNKLEVIRGSREEEQATLKKLDQEISLDKVSGSAI